MTVAIGNDLFLRAELGVRGGRSRGGGADGGATVARACARRSAHARRPRRGHRARTARDLTAMTAAQHLPAAEPPDRPGHGGTFPALIRLARPKQWIKNVLVVAAPGAAGVLGERAVAVPHGDRVRVLLPRGERHVLHQRRARRRRRSSPPDQAVPPYRIGRGLRTHRDRRRRAADRRRDRALVRGALAAGGHRRRLPAADDALQLVAEARGGARPRVRRARDSCCGRSPAASRSG